jgi:hypothetical protein
MLYDWFAFLIRKIHEIYAIGGIATNISVNTVLIPAGPPELSQVTYLCMRCIRNLLLSTYLLVFWLGLCKASFFPDRETGLKNPFLPKTTPDLHHFGCPAGGWKFQSLLSRCPSGECLVRA